MKHNKKYFCFSGKVFRRMLHKPPSKISLWTQVCISPSSSTQSLSIFSVTFHCKKQSSSFLSLLPHNFLHYFLSLQKQIKIYNYIIEIVTCYGWFHAASLSAGHPTSQTSISRSRENPWDLIFLKSYSVIIWLKLTRETEVTGSN